MPVIQSVESAIARLSLATSAGVTDKDYLYQRYRFWSRLSVSYELFTLYELTQALCLATNSRLYTI
jgi:hypothetical protein